MASPRQPHTPVARQRPTLSSRSAAAQVFDAGGMHTMTPLKMKRHIPWHKNEAERAEAAKDTKIAFERFMGKGKVNMWMDT